MYKIEFIDEQPYHQWAGKLTCVSILDGVRGTSCFKITPGTVLVCNDYIFQCLTEVNLKSKRLNDAIYYEPGSILMKKGDEIFCKPPELRYSPIFRLRDCMFPTLSMLKRYNECFAV